MIGAPGSLDRRGSVHKNQIVKSLSDDSRWYDHPDVDSVYATDATLDDYLGLCLCPCCILVHPLCRPFTTT